jgi:hypothetical protein
MHFWFHLKKTLKIFYLTFVKHKIIRIHKYDKNTIQANEIDTAHIIHKVQHYYIFHFFNKFMVHL